MPDSGTWIVRAMEDFQHPGWLYIPHGMTTDVREQWVSAALQDLAPLVGVARWDGTSTTEDHLRALLEHGADDEPVVEALATFQVWPLAGPAVLTCRICVVSSSSVPDWGVEDRAAVHAVDAAEIGPGIQVSTRTTLEDGDDTVDLYSVDLIFDDGDFAAVISLEQGVAAMIANALPGMAVLKDLLRVERPDGSPFVSKPPTMMLDEQPWELTST